MRRRLFNFAAVVSLVLSLATLWKWEHPRSIGGVLRTITAVRGDDSELALCESDDGLLIGLLPNDLQQLESQQAPPGSKYDRRVWSIPGIVAAVWTRFGNGHIAVGAFAPYWFVFVATALLPLQWVRRRASSVILTLRRRKRIREGVCPTCGYDLTGNTSSVCPECGKPVAGEVEAKA